MGSMKRMQTLNTASQWDKYHQKIDQNKIKIKFGNYTVCKNGQIYNKINYLINIFLRTNILFMIAC